MKMLAAYQKCIQINRNFNKNSTRLILLATWSLPSSSNIVIKHSNHHPSLCDKNKHPQHHPHHLNHHSYHYSHFIHRSQLLSSSQFLHPYNSTKHLCTDSGKVSKGDNPGDGKDGGGGGDGEGELVSFCLSDIGEGISEVVIKEWFVKIGDHVQQFDNICEVQSDKASVTITSRYDGTIHKLHYKVDDTAKVGLPLVDILLDGSGSTTSIETEKPKVVIDGEDPNAIKNLQSKVGSSSVTGSEGHDYLGGGKILTAPAVRRLATEHKIHLNQVVGTGKDGRILKEDVLNYIQKMSGQQQSSTTPSATPTEKLKTVTQKPVSTIEKPLAPLAEDRIEPMSNITKGMFKSMTKSLSVPHFGLSEEIDVTRLVQMRSELKKISSEKNVNLSFMPFFIKAASLSLHQYPILNSSIDSSGEKIIYKSAHNIGIAMDTKQGLLVPNIKNVNNLTILEIAQELSRLMELAQRGQLGLSDLSGGTFTLSNIGSIGGIFGIPVMLPGEVAIGAIGRTRQVPRFVDDHSDQIRRAHIIQVLWSADHRIIDGATMTRFCKLWKDYLENPFRILI